MLHVDIIYLACRGRKYPTYNGYLCILSAWFIANAQGKSVYRRDGKKSRCSEDINLLCPIHVRQFDGINKQEYQRKITTEGHQLNSDSSRHMRQHG